MFDLDKDFPPLYVECYGDKAGSYIQVNCICGESWHMGHKFAIGDSLRMDFMPHWLNKCPKRKEITNV